MDVHFYSKLRCSLFIVLYLWTILTALTTSNDCYANWSHSRSYWFGKKSEHILNSNHGFIVKYWTITRIFFVLLFISLAHTGRYKIYNVSSFERYPWSTKKLTLGAIWWWEFGLGIAISPIFRSSKKNYLWKHEFTLCEFHSEFSVKCLKFCTTAISMIKRL